MFTAKLEMKPDRCTALIVPLQLRSGLDRCRPALEGLALHCPLCTEGVRWLEVVTVERERFYRRLGR
ncbi:hypothetical protein E1161_21275 [Saccharopolyspora aridisoli]|uniref:Uncharacterized protein n=1 Tax=Saccharopolyspora aridisoli TaxID=2530385 RepID=A0A4R4URU2_9PSEU|nr:hypothetical protein [Saccharopolyspora aridisoli]TDC89549.1 hypothetical protein E1161_21275 [Saccharopolyspora aridisoli]